ncbi:hypothetical protein BKA82DRAFT_4023370 [Pisolithus tinctorius]|nr:hypothetical protein BKA82DRAFT_4023370 [Pisolithus tinctorius]
MSPVVHAEAWDVYHSVPMDTSLSGSQSVRDSLTPETSIMDLPIPFLPLPHTFDHRNSHQWIGLCKDIERWLVEDVNTSYPQWEWGRDAFWMAFIGSYPMFPDGKWHHWDPDIPLDGQFIRDWLNTDENKMENESGSVTSLEHTLSIVWETFCRHVALFYPFPLISTQ